MLDLYKKRLLVRGKHMGEVLKKQSDIIMDKTFKNDIAYRVCYIDGKPVDAKYIVYTYYSISKDAVDYHLQFRPGVHYPIGTYVDVPDDTNTYNRWLIVGRSDEPQFVKYNILKCNWTFKWIKNDVIYEQLGVLRKRNSYNSGLWTDYYSTSPENQDQFILPTNPITQTLSYNMRLLISDNQIEPIAWEISKIEDTMPVGITYFTIKQDLYNPNIDNKELMIADYYKSKVEPVKDDEDDYRNDIKIKYNAQAAIKVGGSYKIFNAVSDIQDFDSSLISWKIEGISEDDYSTILSSNQIKIKSSKNYNLIGKVFTLNLLYEDHIVDSIQVEVIGL